MCPAVLLLLKGHSRQVPIYYNSLNKVYKNVKPLGKIILCDVFVRKTTNNGIYSKKKASQNELPPMKFYSF
jgi:hypothetical protein